MYNSIKKYVIQGVLILCSGLLNASASQYQGSASQVASAALSAFSVRSNPRQVALLRNKPSDSLASSSHASASSQHFVPTERPVSPGVLLRDASSVRLAHSAQISSKRDLLTNNLTGKLWFDMAREQGISKERFDQELAAYPICMAQYVKGQNNSGLPVRTSDGSLALQVTDSHEVKIYEANSEKPIHTISVAKYPDVYFGNASVEKPHAVKAELFADEGLLVITAKGKTTQSFGLCEGSYDCYPGYQCIYQLPTLLRLKTRVNFYDSNKVSEWLFTPNGAFKLKAPEYDDKLKKCKSEAYQLKVVVNHPFVHLSEDQKDFVRAGHMSYVADKQKWTSDKKTSLEKMSKEMPGKDWRTIFNSLNESAREQFIESYKLDTTLPKVIEVQDV